MSATTTTSRHIAIIGSGPVGVALAKLLVKAHYSVSLSNSRGPDSLTRQARETGARAMDIKDAMVQADIVVLAVPVASVVPIASTSQKLLRSGTVLIDSGNYYPSRDGRVEALDNGMPDTAWVAQKFSLPVVKAFNNIIADKIFTDARPKGSPQRVTLPISGDDDKAVKAIMVLVEEIGFDAYNAGPLADSWRYQPGQPAYCTEPNQEQLRTLLAKADRVQGPVNRDKVRAMVEKLPPNYSPQTLLRVSRLSAGLDKWNIRSWISAVTFAFALARGTIASKLA